ncbi:TolC family protein [Dysgonomonas sp. BGC7]|uniref:TolC family protein n=1 Tax=Dysgonomonas sp. BGC7 TaxID=1658008 RepID=UPI0006801453|nr:TolC family protein [Dysgonomonas sp. BGC7]MBD8389287.1 TolC family protein [Dysgonomonas sp. BGC7]
MKTYIIAIGLLFSLSSLAQNKWTLRQCIDYAVENNIELQQQSLNVKSAEIDLSTTKNSRLPDLNASLGQGFDFGRSISDDNTSVASNSSRSSFNVKTSIPLFTGFKIPNQIKVDKLNLQAATEGLKKAKENLELQVVSLFLEVLFKKEIQKAYEEQFNQSKFQVDKTEILLQTGKIPASQLYDIKAQAAKDELNIIQASNDLSLSLLNLSQSLNLPVSEGFDIVQPDLGDDAIDNNIGSVLPPNNVYQMALGIKPHVKEAELKLESSKKSLKVAQSGYWPTLNFEANYQTYYLKLSGVRGMGFFDQMNKRGSESLGFSLSIPLFNRFQTRNQVRSARLNIENQSLILENVKLALFKDIQQAYQSAVNAQAKYTSTGKAFDAAEESFKYARERYEAGKSTVFELNEAQTKLLTSKSERIQAKYDFIFRAKILDFYQGKEINID